MSTNCRSCQTYFKIEKGVAVPPVTFEDNPRYQTNATEVEEPKPEPTPQPQPKVEEKPEPAPAPAPEPTPAPEPEPKSEPEPLPEPILEPEPEPTPEIKAEPEPAPQPKAAPKAETTAESQAGTKTSARGLLSPRQEEACHQSGLSFQERIQKERQKGRPQRNKRGPPASDTPLPSESSQPSAPTPPPSKEPSKEPSQADSPAAAGIPSTQPRNPLPKKAVKPKAPPPPPKPEPLQAAPPEEPVEKTSFRRTTPCTFKAGRARSPSGDSGPLPSSRLFSPRGEQAEDLTSHQSRKETRRQMLRMPSVPRDSRRFQVRDVSPLRRLHRSQGLRYS